MRVNQPVTTIEQFLEPGKPIVTKTGLDGKILYANESFVKISGFTREELIGADHNIVRHPDMPPAAFADLWRTVRAGQPWRGLVKNRTKTGDFYWVEAFVTPITESGRTVGFMSVRNTPSRDQVVAAETLYARIRAGQAPFPMTPLSRARYSAAVPFWLASLAISGLGIGAGAVGGAWGVGLGALAGAVALVVVALLHNGILRPLDGLRAGLEALDEGRLGERIETPAGSHRALRAPYSQLEVMRIHLRAMFADVLVSAHDIEAKSRKLDDAVRSLGKTAQDQSDRLSQVAAAMEQMSVSVNEISENTAQGVEAARRTEGLAQDGMTVMAAGIESSGRVVTIVETSRDEITQVNEAVARIGEVTNIIREIAEQTNLLALNAAIEAARAGEHGRGFAVVADEVRKLSERTSVSTQHISSAVGDIVRRAHSAVATMGSASQDVVASTERIRASSESLQQIWAASGDAVRAADEITGTLQQQSTASQEVAKAMEQISGSVEATTHDVSTIGEATTALRGTAEEMRLLIRHLEGALK